MHKDQMHGVKCSFICEISDDVQRCYRVGTWLCLSILARAQLREI